MNPIILDSFKKISEQKYVVVNRQIWMAVMGGGGFLLVSYFLLPEIVTSFREVNFFMGLLVLIMYLVLGGMLLICVPMGLFTITTEIDLATRKARITKRNIRGASATWEASLDNICINAQRMGGFDPGTLQGCWIVRAGFMYKDEDDKESSVAIWSKEVDKIQNIKERNEIMFELYKFFFPDRPAVTEANLITNGSVVMLLSDEEIEEFKRKMEKPALFEKKPEDDNGKDNSRWDKLF